jgi:predicted nucleic acid-binding protein
MIVVDTNVLACLLLPGRENERARRALRKDPEWAAPLLWRSELRSVLATYVTTQGVELASALALMERAEALLAPRTYEVPSTDVLRLATTSGCSAYDCEFVALAEAARLPLITSDRQILRAFPRLARTLSSFA